VSRFQADLVEAPPGEVYRGSTHREVGEPAGGRGRRYVAALFGGKIEDEDAAASCHAQTRPRRVILLQLRAGHAEGSRTHYLAG
jgi:hypothetical protein